MSHRQSPSQLELETLLRRARLIRRVPSGVRARVLARARSTVGAAATALPQLELFAPLPRRGLSVALAGAAALTIGVAGAVVALRDRAPHTPAVSSTPKLRPTASSELLPPEPASPEPTVTPPAMTGRASGETPRHPAAVSAQESYAAELDLLHRAQAAYASRDFSSALGILAEHAQRFPKGRLAEEREALRVRSLSGSGRAAEAERAAAAFAAHFPRSVLLPRSGTIEPQ